MKNDSDLLQSGELEADFEENQFWGVLALENELHQKLALIKKSNELQVSTISFKTSWNISLHKPFYDANE
jgi:hypothetical protein